MSGPDRRRHARGAAFARRVFSGAVARSAGAYVRGRDLPRLLALWPHEIEDTTEAGRLHLLARLRRALRAERRRARAGHWSYDLNRHLGLLSAYKGELATLASDRPVLSRTARAAATAEPRDEEDGRG